MIKQLRLGDLIHDKIPLRVLPTGWETCKCQLCNDYKDRASFLFSGDEIIYSCFNCGVSSRYEEFNGKISKNFRKILNAYDVDDDEINAIVNTAFFNKCEKSETITLAKLTKINTATPTINLPPKSFPLGHHEFVDYQEKLVQYLVDRSIDFNKYKFFFSLEERFLNRVIIPFYRQGNLIYWQARSIVTDEKKRYDNAPVGRDAIMFNFDQLNSYVTTPLFVVEGVFDAMVLDGLAIVGSKLTSAKIELLTKTKRRIVFVIDKDTNGRHLAENVLNQGWEITFATNGAEDVNQSVQRFGLSWTIYELMKNIRKAEAAKMSINLNCK